MKLKEALIAKYGHDDINDTVIHTSGHDLTEASEAELHYALEYEMNGSTLDRDLFVIDNDIIFEHSLAQDLVNNSNTYAEKVEEICVAAIAFRYVNEAMTKHVYELPQYGVRHTGVSYIMIDEDNERITVISGKQYLAFS